MKLQVLDGRGTEIEAKPGAWYPWMAIPPPRDIGPLLCRKAGERFTVDPSGVPGAWNVYAVEWQMPIREDQP